MHYTICIYNNGKNKSTTVVSGVSNLTLTADKNKIKDKIRDYTMHCWSKKRPFMRLYMPTSEKLSEYICWILFLRIRENIPI